MIALTGNKMVIGQPLPVEEDIDAQPDDVYSAESGNDQAVTYRLWDRLGSPERLAVIPDRKRWNLAIKTIDLWHSPTQFDQAFIKIWHDRLYVLGGKTIVFDITDPVSPKRISEDPGAWSPNMWIRDNGAWSLVLPPAPGLPDAERLKFALRCRSAVYQFPQASDGDIFCELIGREIDVMRLKSISGNRAVFEAIGVCRPTLIQSLFTDLRGPLRLRLRNGLIYVTSAGYVNVFDIRNSKLVAHFAVPNIMSCEPLADGRAIAGGLTAYLSGNSVQYAPELYLLGPPPRK
jgi:hypothetical protein